MPLKLTCPRCGVRVPLVEPLPLPGSEVQCTGCAAGLSVSYPDQVIAHLTARGKRFAEPSGPSAAPLRPAKKRAPAPPRPSTFLPELPAASHALPPPDPAPERAPPERVSAEDASPTTPSGAVAATEVDRTWVEPTQIGEPDPADYFEIDRTVPALRSPYGGLPRNVSEPESVRSVALPAVGPTEDLPVDEPSSAGTVPYDDAFRDLQEDDEPVLASPEPSHPQALPRNEMSAKPAKSRAKTSNRKRGLFGCTGLFGAGLTGLVALAGLAVVGAAAVAGGGYWYYSQDLPSIEALQAYQPATVTVVTDTHGEVLGEIFEERRYVIPMEQIPEHVQLAFISAEDGNFWEHGGVDYVGITRAIFRNVAAGRKAQGASTITQQVAKNFLLTRDKSYERKIKEILLSWRIENAYSKEHILYLYLNEIFLGSQAYGVEAASRAFFGKSVQETTLAEAAILAGLPQRPSDYNPHSRWEKAQERQIYVLSRMLAEGHITPEEHAEALAEEITIAPRGNVFLEQAPHFTEHVRRYLVDTYGEERVLQEGLQVRTTCDLELQRLAQNSVTTRVHEVDQRMGFRRKGLTTLADGEIQGKRDEHELAMRKQWAHQQDPAGRIDLPERSILTVGETYEAVILEVQPKWARVGLGAHEGIIPLAYSEWVYEPNPRRSWRNRTADDLTRKVDTDEDGVADTPILQKGDVILVKVEALSTKDEAVTKAFQGTPGAKGEAVALRLWQEPEVEAALLSLDVETGAVRAMVGGSDFRKSQFNRAIQSRRQVGSTFKPLVYAAAIEARRVTPASMIADAPLAFATADEFVWKPANYGHDYLGNITLRRALAMSRNTCTVRVLEAMDPGMNNDLVYDFARRVGIGGPPKHRLPEDWVPTPENDLLCPWTRETRDSTICMDRYPPKDPDISNTRHRQELGPDDEYWCRACDMSMGLGSASLTMEELVRAYSAFATDGQLVEPYYIEEVRDRDGQLLETHEPVPRVQVTEPEVASISRWLLQSVVHGGTASQAGSALGLQGLAGKTGTTNDEKDAWFVGFTNDVIAAVWVGYDQPESLGTSSTGGRTALPIWIDYMREAAPKDRDRPFPMTGEIEWAQIDENTGRRVRGGGRRYPFIKGTTPEATGVDAGQVTLEDLTTEL